MEYIIIAFLIACFAIRFAAKGRKPNRSRTHYEEYLEMTKMIKSLSTGPEEVRRSADERTDEEAE